MANTSDDEKQQRRPQAGERRARRPRNGNSGPLDALLEGAARAARDRGRDDAAEALERVRDDGRETKG
ncbi:MAG: hypothetical protein EPN20_12425 [Magnetospirillum sp.]|nr:MAG: hypothetical protein EPN20_12425 [Magnetospirillum sp.]